MRPCAPPAKARSIDCKRESPKTAPGTMSCGCLGPEGVALLDEFELPVDPLLDAGLRGEAHSQGE